MTLLAIVATLVPENTGLRVAAVQRHLAQHLQEQLSNKILLTQPTVRQLPTNHLEQVMEIRLIVIENYLQCQSY